MSEDHNDNSAAGASDQQSAEKVVPVRPWISRRIVGDGMAVLFLVDFLGSATGHWHELWIECFVSGGVLLGGLWVYEYSVKAKSCSQLKGITLAIVAIVTLSGLLAEAYHFGDKYTSHPTEPKPEPFSATYSWTQSEGPGPHLWMLQQDAVTPIYCSLLATITNTSSRPFMVYSFKISEQITDRWEMVSPDTGVIYSVFFTGQDRKEVYEQSFVTLESAVANKSISPGESIRGWVFLTKEWSGRLEFTMMDALGNVSTVPFVSLGSKDASETHPGFPMQPLLNSFAGKGKQDISHYPIYKKPTQ